MRAIYLKNIPKDVAVFILKAQGEIKVKKGIGKYSQSATVVGMLQEYITMKKQKGN